MGYKTCIKLLEEIKQSSSGISKDLQKIIDKEIENYNKKNKRGYFQ